MLDLGGAQINRLMLGATEIRRAYLGPTLVYESNPYASYIAAYDFRTATGYTLTTGRVSAAVNLGTGGAGYDASQSVAIDRPTIGAMTDAVAAAAFTTSGEFLEANGLATLMNPASTAAFRIRIIFENNNTGTQQALATWSKAGSNNGYMIISTDGTGDIRIRRRSVDGLSDVSVDSVVKITANVTQTLDLEFGDGLVSGYLNGVAAFTNVNYVGASGTLACDKFAFGARNTPSFGLAFNGEIAFVGVEML